VIAGGGFKVLRIQGWQVDLDDDARGQAERIAEAARRDAGLG
jgi:hypothetical protein